MDCWKNLHAHCESASWVLFRQMCVASVCLLGMWYILAEPRDPGRSFANNKHTRIVSRSINAVLALASTCLSLNINQSLRSQTVPSLALAALAALFGNREFHIADISDMAATRPRRFCHTATLSSNPFIESESPSLPSCCVQTFEFSWVPRASSTDWVLLYSRIRNLGFLERLTLHPTESL